MDDPNIEMFKKAVGHLGDLANELVFVGGSAAGLLITDKGSAGVRATTDVDAIVEAISYAQYVAFSEKLLTAGFINDTSEDAPLCRWLKDDSVLDIMPLDESILGFSSRWYKPAIENAESHEILPDIEIRVVSSPYFCATKLEAFNNRGGEDYLSSRDLEDLMNVIDGREELANEISDSALDVKEYISLQIRDMLGDNRFLDALPGYLQPDEANQARIGELLNRLNRIANL